MDWLQPVWNMLQQFNPVEMVYEYNHAVRFTNGTCEKKPLKTGVNFRLPFFQHIVEMAKVPEVKQFDTQTIGTHDGKTITIAANIEIVIVDPVALQTKIYRWEDSLRGEITGHLTERINAQSYDEVMLNGGLTKLQASLKNTLTTKVKDWGLKIERVTFNEFSPTQQAVRLYSDQPLKL
jgi:regulator of protease activity HflC (stomatin/prohibitin superfamily)